MQSSVYFLKPDQWREIPEAMEKAGIGGIVSKDDFVAIKIHFGEKGNVGYIKPEILKPLIKKIKELGGYPFVTDANTIYRGERTDAVRHLMLAAEHGFHPKFLGCPVVIADGLRGNSYVEVDIYDGCPALAGEQFPRLKSGVQDVGCPALAGKNFPTKACPEQSRGVGHPKHFQKVKIAEAIYYADVIISVAHFKGHDLCGIGGAIKNLGMGCAARPGKYEQHNSIVPKVNAALCTACGACVKWCSGNALSLVVSKEVVCRWPLVVSKEATNDQRLTANDSANRRLKTIHLDPSKCIGCGQCILACNFKVFSIPWNEDSAIVQEKMAEYAAGVLKNKKAFFINFLTFITEHCDCFKTITKPLVPDIGILLSTDPVAIDHASLELVKKHADKDILKEKTGQDGTRQIEYAEKLGLGSKDHVICPVTGD